MKLGQNVCLNEILNKFENGSCRVKKVGHLDHILEKPCVHSRGYILGLILMKLGQNVCLSKILD